MIAPIEIRERARMQRGNVFLAVQETLERYGTLPNVRITHPTETIKALSAGGVSFCFPHTAGFYDCINAAAGIGVLLKQVSLSVSMPHLALHYRVKDFIDPDNCFPKLMPVEHAGLGAEPILAKIIYLLNRRTTGTNLSLVKSAVSALNEGGNFATAPNGGKLAWYDTFALILSRQTNPNATVIFVDTQPGPEKNILAYTPLRKRVSFERETVTISRPVPAADIIADVPNDHSHHALTKKMEQAFNLWGKTLRENPNADFPINKIS